MAETTQTITITVTSDDPLSVEELARSTIDNADPTWTVESAEIESDGVVTDLLEELDATEDIAGTEGTTQEETQTQDAPETQDTPQDSDPTRLPTGKEF